MFTVLFLNSQYNYRRSALFLFLGLLFSTSIAFSQPENWVISYFSTEDGLSSNQVNYVMKDSKGFIWLGTNNGLNKFDGYTFSSLKLPSGIDHPLSRLKVLTIFEDRDSILWIGTSDGLFRYNTSEPVTQIRQFQYRDIPDSLTYRFSLPIFEICEDKNDLLWMICYDRDDIFGYELHSFDKRSENFKLVFVDSSFFCNAGDDESLHGWFNSVYPDRNGDLWFGSNRGLLKYNYERDSFELSVPFPGSQLPSINSVDRIHEDSQGNFWVSNAYGMSSVDRQTMTFKEHIPLEPVDGTDSRNSSWINRIGEDQKGYLWIRVNQSLVRILPKKGGGLDFGSMEFWETENTSFASNPMVSLLVESPWIVWLGIPNKGLCRVNVRRNDFKAIQPTSLHQTGGYDLDFINALYLDSLDKLWLSWIDPGVIQYELSNSNSTYFDPVPYKFIHGIETDQYGNMWFATRYAYGSRASADEKGKIKFTLYHPDENDPASITRRTETYVKNSGVSSHDLFEHLLFKDRYGTLWFNSATGFHDRYDPGTDGFIHLDHSIAGYFNNDTCVEAEIEGEIWFPSVQGLLRLLPPFEETAPFTITPGSSILYNNRPDDATSLSSDWVRSLCFSTQFESGTLWIGTIGGGLNKLIRAPLAGTNKYEVHFQHYTIEDGLCDNNVLGIIEDEKGYLWLSTQNGLSRFDPRTDQFNNFYKEDGLPSNHFSWADPYQNSSGDLFFPTEAGVLTFQPDEIHTDTSMPPIVITDFRIFNEPVFPGQDSPLKQDISFSKTLELKYDQNFLSFEFAALSYEKTERNLYKYMLEGFDRDWVPAGSRRFVEYKGLKPGVYTFKVQGSNNSGVWNKMGASMEINIQNPPWQRWWAWSIYILLVSGIVIWYRGILVKRERLKTAVEIERVEKQKIREIDSFRSRFFTNISHEFRTPLTLLIGPLEDSVNKGGEEVSIKLKVIHVMLRNARRLQRLINQLLDISKIESAHMRLQLSLGPLPEYVRTIASSFLSIAESKKIHFSIHVEEIDFETFFDPDKMEKVITNLLSNAFKFTQEEQMVSLNLAFKPSKELTEQTDAILRVSDSGKGIEREAMEHIFDRFYQVSDSDTRDVEGSGIGLALTKELVELMHGNIHVESERGKGTDFIVTFPVSKGSFSEHEIAAIQPLQEPSREWEGIEEVHGKPEPHSDNASPGEVIMVVEDNPDLRDYISQQFRDTYKVIEANNGIMGLEKAIENIPDLVVTDLMMPEMGGVELCRKLKKLPATNHIPVIMLTAKADRESKLEGLEALADDYIVKPFDSELLKARASNLITQRRELRKNFEKSFLVESSNENSASPQFIMLREILKILDSHLSNPDFKLDHLCQELNFSRGQLFRKIHAVTGTTPNELLRIVRMKRAARYLRAGQLNVTQTMYHVGMLNPSHFAKSFRKYFGINPSEYIKVDIR